MPSQPLQLHQGAVILINMVFLHVTASKAFGYSSACSVSLLVNKAAFVFCIVTVSRASEWEGPTESEDQVPQHKLAQLGRLLYFSKHWWEYISHYMAECRSCWTQGSRCCGLNPFPVWSAKLLHRIPTFNPCWRTWWHDLHYDLFNWYFLPGDSEEVKAMLQNPHLRAMLENLVNSSDPAAGMEAAMQEPIFVELADQCLKVVEGEGPQGDWQQCDARGHRAHCKEAEHTVTELPWGNETEQITPCNAFRPVLLELKGLVWLYNNLCQMSWACVHLGTCSVFLLPPWNFMTFCFFCIVARFLAWRFDHNGGMGADAQGEN